MAGPGQHFPMASRGSLPPSQMMPPQQSMGGYMPPASQIGPIQGPGMPGPGPGGPAGENTCHHLNVTFQHFIHNVCLFVCVGVLCRSNSNSVIRMVI